METLLNSSPDRVGDTLKYLVSHKLQNNIDRMEVEDLQKQGLKYVAYLKKVSCSQKMLALQKNSSNYTVGEFILLDSHAFDFEGDSVSSNMANIRKCLLQRSSLWSLMMGQGRRLTNQMIESNSDKLTSDVTTCVSLADGNFSFCPPEVNFQIFSNLPQASILQCRCVCQSWRTQIDFFFAFHTVLTTKKLGGHLISKKLRIPPFEINHYDITEFTRPLKHKHFMDLPSPKSVRILHKMSSKNFLKLMDSWRQIEYLTFHLEPLTSLSLFEKWTNEYQLEYFPQLKVLNMNLDRLHLPRYKSFNPKQLRFNLDQILMNPYTNLHTFSFQMLNSGRHFACAFLAPILMFMGRQRESLRKIQIIFHTGYEFETLPSYSVDQHAPSYYIPLDDQIYVHGEINLLLLPLVKLTHVSLALPAISGCTTRSGICNHFCTLLKSQKYLGVLHLEIQIGVQLQLIESLIVANQNLIDIELTVNLPLGEVFNLTVFSKCQQLKSLRLKRVGFIDLPSQVSQIENIERLPRTLIKLALHRFYMSVMDLYMIFEDKPFLQCLCICCCYIEGTREDEFLVDGAMTKILSHSDLKFLCFSPIRRNTLNKIIYKLRTNPQFSNLVNSRSWNWSILSRELWLAKPRRLILHKGQEYCTKAWFRPCVFEKVKV